MKMPGFSAEKSLGHFRERYEAHDDATRDSGGGAIQPQICRRQGNSIVCYQCSDGYCWTNVIHIPTLY